MLHKQKNQIQTIYICLDDSGKISKKEKIAVYGGVVFLNKQEKDKFITQYKSIISSIKCKYCKFNKDNCLNTLCPELKHYNLKAKDKRRILNYIKKYILISCVIENQRLYNYIISNSASKGRYNDYALRRTIKGIIAKLINSQQLDANKPLNLIVNIDEQPTKSNGYYDLKDGLIEELKYGIINFNYGKTSKAIIHSNLSIEIHYQNSNKCYLVQAADLVAGTARKTMINISNNSKAKDNIFDFIDYKIFLP